MLPLRILWVSDSPLLNTGYAKVGRELLPRLARRVERVAAAGWFHPGEEVVRKDGYRIYPAGGSFGAGALESILEAEKPDLIITLGDFWMFDWWRKSPLFGSVPVVGYHLLDGKVAHRAFSEALQASSYTAAASGFAAEVIRRAVRDKEAPIIPFGVDPDVYRPADDMGEARAALPAGANNPPVGKDRFIVGCVARNQPRKQFPLLLKAFAAFSADKPDALLYLHTSPMDSGWDLPELIKEHGLTERTLLPQGVTALTGVSEKEMAQVFSAFDVCVLPSAGEGFGLPVLEAMACGVPVVATDCSALSELVRDRGELIRVRERLLVGQFRVEQALPDTDHLVELMERLYLDPELRQEYGQRGRAFAETMTWDRCADGWTGYLGQIAHELQRTEASEPKALPLEKAADLSIIIAVHGQRVFTEECLRTLRLDAPEAEIICIDNGSPDDTLEWLRGQPGLTVIPLPQNIGVPAAWNLGLQAASRGVLCLVHNDVSIHPGGVRALRAAALKTGIAAIAGGTLSDELEFAGHTTRAAESDYPVGCALAFRREVFEAVGLFDEGMGFGYYEDADWGIRARIAGFEWTIVPDVLIHAGSQTTRRLPGRAELLARNTARLRERWQRLPNGAFAPRTGRTDDASDRSPASQVGRTEREQERAGDAGLVAASPDGMKRLPEPYRSLTLLPFDGHGWIEPPNQRGLAQLLTERDVAVAVELGSWLGRSTRWIAGHLPPDGRLYAVDTWAGSPEMRGARECEDRFPSLYQQFLSNIVHAGLASTVIPVRMTTEEAARALAVCPDLVYVDACHDEAAVYQDIMAWQGKLAPNGVLCGDDWRLEGVQRAVRRAAAALDKTVHCDDNFWWFI